MPNSALFGRLAKYVMEKNLSPFTQAKLDVDQRLADELRRCGVYSTLADISRACGKNPTYFNCMRKKGYGLHVGSLVFLQAMLMTKCNKTEDIRLRGKLRLAINAVNTAVQEKIRLREMELD